MKRSYNSQIDQQKEAEVEQKIRDRELEIRRLDEVQKGMEVEKKEKRHLNFGIKQMRIEDFHEKLERKRKEEMDLKKKEIDQDNKNLKYSDEQAYKRTEERNKVKGIFNLIDSK